MNQPQHMVADLQREQQELFVHIPAMITGKGPRKRQNYFTCCMLQGRPTDALGFSFKTILNCSKINPHQPILDLQTISISMVHYPQSATSEVILHRNQLEQPPSMRFYNIPVQHLVYPLLKSFGQRTSYKYCPRSKKK